MDQIERVVLIGFSGTGKSTVARLVAAHLGWDVADVDSEIACSWGASIPAIFRERGETAFRERERSILSGLMSRTGVVVAAGGGVAAQPDAWDASLLGSTGTITVALDAPPETIVRRLQSQAASEGEPVERPLLAAADPLQRVIDLKAARQTDYDRATITLSSAGVTPEHIAAEIASLARLSQRDPLHHRLEAMSGSSDISIAPGAIMGLGERARQRWPKSRRAWIISDGHVGPLHAPAAAASLEAAGFAAASRFVAPGEASKSLGTVGALYDWLFAGEVERGDVIVALGGGMVGDLAGFVAATVLRGIAVVQAPTTLLATVDSSVGGKTGINHAAGKNLIGSFLQPPLVIIDTDLLRTVPPRELRSGWAEVVKHAVIQHSTPGGERNDLAAVLERNVDRLNRLEGLPLAYLILRNVQLKSAVVARDEREANIRAFLNFGHTLGHAIEAADYSLLHGEAVAIGMRAAAALGVAHGTCEPADAKRIGHLIGLFDLPTTAPVDSGTVLARLRYDKKRAEGRQRYVLPLRGGGVVIRDDVPDPAVMAALNQVAAPVPVG